MVGTRKTPSGRTTVMLNDSPGLEVVGDEFEEDTTDIIDQFSVLRSSVPPYLDSNTTSPYLSNSVDLHTPHSALTPSSSFASPNKRPTTPTPVLDLDHVPNIRYFRGQWVYVENLDRLDQKPSWEAVNGTG
ncbi:hypothetical protein BKA64DRAFT_641006 [Cadophora sp. MPI-SDFR-AT-0126]|nr:hypothetical protein BKA64DRAFT_641006 [Leotiomycetes sp. MPI-SDFR-AT-0126]